MNGKNPRKDEITQHEPNKYLKIGFFKFWVFCFSELYSSYGLGWRLFLREFTGKYKQRILGVLWVIIAPMVAALSFTLLANSRILQISNLDVPYPLYVFLSVASWQLIQNSVVNISNVLNNAGSIILRINFPRISLIISPFYTSILNFIIQFVFFLLLCFYYGFSFSPANIFAIGLLFPAILLGTGIGMLLAIVGAVIKDIGNMLSFLFQFLMLVTPIVYPKPENSLIGDIAEWNPFYYLVIVPRDMILLGRSPDLVQFAYFSIFALIIFFAGWRFFIVAVVRITEKI